jgi:hypothetical protein
MGRLRIGTRYVVSDDHPTKKFPPRKKNLCHSLTKEKVVCSKNSRSMQKQYHDVVVQSPRVNNIKQSLQKFPIN